MRWIKLDGKGPVSYAPLENVVKVEFHADQKGIRVTLYVAGSTDSKHHPLLFSAGEVTDPDVIEKLKRWIEEDLNEKIPDPEPSPAGAPIAVRNYLKAPDL